MGFVSGRVLFQKVNTSAQVVSPGHSTVTNPPTTFGKPAQATLVDIQLSTHVAHIVSPPGGNGAYLVLMLTAPLSAGTMAVPITLLRVARAGLGTGGTATTLDLATYLSAHPNVVAGTKLGYSLYSVDATTFIANDGIDGIITVVA